MMANPTTDEAYAHFSDDNRQFLARIFHEHPAIAEKFDYYLKLPAVLRYRLAKVELQDVARTGWVIKGIPEPEAVYDHLHGLKSLVETFFNRFLPYLSDEERVTTMRMQRRMEGMAMVHDIPEAIVGDLTPQDHEKKKINGSDKQHMEYLAAQILFEDHPESMVLYQEFHEQKTAASQMLHDLDKIHAVLGAIFYEAKHPEKTNLWPEFYPYAQSKMKTEPGRNFLEEIARDREAHIAMLRAPTPEMRAARGR